VIITFDVFFSSLFFSTCMTHCFLFIVGGMLLRVALFALRQPVDPPGPGAARESRLVHVAGLVGGGHAALQRFGVWPRGSFRVAGRVVGVCGGIRHLRRWVPCRQIFFMFSIFHFFVFILEHLFQFVFRFGALVVRRRTNPRYKYYVVSMFVRQKVFFILALY
jgi:hypothetical protein